MDETLTEVVGETQLAGEWAVEPFLHVEPDHLYNPLSDLMLGPADLGYAQVRRVATGEGHLGELAPGVVDALAGRGWLMPHEGLADPRLGSRFFLKYVSLEAHTVCNQSCFFCPVSVAPRESHFMSMELYRSIAQQLSAWRSTIAAVFMINYNEPTADKRFVEQVRVLKEAGLPVAVLTNATGLTPSRVDEIVAMGGLRFLRINLSTLDRDRYRDTRGGDHLKVVLRNLDYAKDKAVAEGMDMIVLGTGDAAHEEDFEAISARFAGSRFEVSKHRVMDRAGLLKIGAKPARPHGRLAGCENLGSRPLQHLHITPHGQCVLCCEDYHEKYVVGDLNASTVEEVLKGPEVTRLREWVYGLTEAPGDFMCRHCIFARTR
jgi:pyruvate-formate lyase-activating enzyme